ncbi:MAG: glycoside hydrolase family 10 protein [Vicinamibacteria bacterium]
MIGAFLALLLAAPAPKAAAPHELRGLWVVRTALVSPEAVDRVVDQAAAAGFNALLVQVRGRGDAFYQSSLVPRSATLSRQPPSFDPLARLLARARDKDLAVHAWVNVLLVAGFQGPLPAGHVLRRHPEWLMVPKAAAASALREPASVVELVRQASRSDADVEGFYLSPGAPGVPEHLEAVVRELLRGYAFDGLHYDFVRYPNKDFDYSLAMLQAFRARRNGRDPLATALEANGDYAQFRRELLTDLVARLSGAARAERPGLVISAAVVPDEATALQVKFQSWPSWSARGLLDALVPMAYSPDARIYREQVERARDLVGGARVWAGVPAYRLPLEGIVRRIETARELGAGGVVVFSHESLGPEDLPRLRSLVFGADSRSPVARPAGGGF